MEKLKKIPSDEPIFVMKKAYKFSGVGTKGLACFVFFMGYVLYTNHPTPGLIFMIGGIFVFLISLYDGTIKKVLLYDDKIIFERDFGIYKIAYDEIALCSNIKIGLGGATMFSFGFKAQTKSRWEGISKIKALYIFRLSNLPFTNKDFKNFMLTLEQKRVKQWKMF